MLWIFAERFFMAALRQCEKSEGCFAVFTAQPWTAAVLFKLQFSDGLLGAGGMGEVYRARDTRLDRTVAVKILPAHLSDNLEFKQRFEREARAISSLNHPHICHLYDIGSQDG